MDSDALKSEPFVVRCQRKEGFDENACIFEKNMVYCK